ncbi:ABC transporter [Streptomyces sp. DJ]|nr:ABC transporter [Streptomyces sp. DJ]
MLRLWPWVRPVRARLIGSAAAAVTASCLGLLFPLVLKEIVDGPVADRDPAGIWLPAVALLGLGVAEVLLFGLRRWLVARSMAGVETRLRADLYRHLQRLPVAFHDRWASGQLLSRATGDLTVLRMFLAFVLVFLVVNGTTIVVGLGILLAQDWLLGLVLLAPTLPLIAVCSLFETRYALQTRRAQDQAGDLATVIEESVLGIRVIKAFGRHRSQARAFHRQSEQLRGTELRKARLLSDLWAVVIGLPELAMGAALVIGCVQVADGDLSAGTLVAFLAVALALRWPVDSIGWMLAFSNEAATAADRYFEVMDSPPADPDGEDLPLRRDGLRFEGVRFRHPDAPPGSPDLLRGVDLHVRPGETMALVGATGSGKTTLTSLVPRLHEATGGRILLDGADVSRLPRERLRELVAVAFEDPVLFSATVRENVLMGAEGAGEEALLRALETAQAQFVHGLPEGPDTEVGEQGLSLSGGQRQRLALARAVVGSPRFLVLDDPLSALDVHTESLVEAALRRVLATTTALVVAHRPSTVLLADRVALLDGGRIAAVGTHHELLERCPRYRELMSGRAVPAEDGRDGTPERTPAP